MGKPYSIIRVLFIPFFNLIQAYSNIEIHYKADVKGGLLVLHPSIGVVISGLAIIGENLTLTWGNIIGGRKDAKEIVLGNKCHLGANAVVLGPVVLGNNIVIGASACVINSCESDNVVLVGVPAKPTIKK